MGMGQSLRRRRDANAWRALLVRFAQCGLSVADFCRHEDISAASFYRWRNLLSAQARLDDTPADHRSDIGLCAESREHNQRADVTMHPVSFIDLGTLNGGQGSDRTRFEIRLDLGAGVVLHLVRG